MGCTSIYGGRLPQSIRCALRQVEAITPPETRNRCDTSASIDTRRAVALQACLHQPMLLRLWYATQRSCYPVIDTDRRRMFTRIGALSCFRIPKGEFWRAAAHIYPATPHVVRVNEVRRLESPLVCLLRPQASRPYKPAPSSTAEAGALDGSSGILHRVMTPGGPW
jgi:hypothetical protein